VAFVKKGRAVVKGADMLIAMQDARDSWKGIANQATTKKEEFEAIIDKQTDHLKKIRDDLRQSKSVVSAMREKKIEAQVVLDETRDALQSKADDARMFEVALKAKVEEFKDASLSLKTSLNAVEDLTEMNDSQAETLRDARAMLAESENAVGAANRAKDAVKKEMVAMARYRATVAPELKSGVILNPGEMDGSDASDQLGVSESTVRAWTRKGKLRARRATSLLVANGWAYKTSDIEALKSDRYGE
jgi:histidinol-phosphate/aromatic aminotransferase/cobyric acid decarboxylase-like protein